MKLRRCYRPFDGIVNAGNIYARSLQPFLAVYGKNSGGRVSEKRTIPFRHGFTKTVLLDRPVRVVGDSRTEMLAFFGRTQFNSSKNQNKTARSMKEDG